jgi:dethiobiotin synthetase
VTAALALALKRRGVDVGVVKPVESGGGDAEALKEWAELDEPLDEIAPFRFAEPVAPLVSARAEGRALTLDQVHARVNELAARHELMLVEGAGGVLVPAGEGWTILDLAAALGFPVLVVARPGLGTVNHSLLTVDAVRRAGLEVVGVVLNGDDALVASNRELIEEFGDVATFHNPWDGPIDQQLVALWEEARV